MLKLLHEIADKAIQIPDHAGLAVRMELTRRRKQLEAQLSLARRAILSLKGQYPGHYRLAVLVCDFEGQFICRVEEEEVL